MQKHTLPPLLYKYDALEPWIDQKTMEIHHSKHHQAYVDKLNAALEKHPELFDKSLEDLLRDINQVPENIRQAVINHGGGHWNHSFFWKTMTPSKYPPVKELEKFKKEFSEKALGIFGSGWTWVVKSANGLEILTTPNQNCPLMENKTPVLGLDVWEHAYYLKYQNRRAEYIDAWWNVINWQEVKNLFLH